MHRSDLPQTGLVEAIDVVGDGVRLIDMSRRNQNVAVVRAAAPSFLIKQDPRVRTHVTREHDVYGLMHEQDDPVSRHVPQLVEHRDGQLRVEYFPTAGSINQLVDDAGHFPAWIAAGVGAWLGQLHTADRLLSSAVGQRFQGTLPWVLSIDSPTPELIQTSSGATLRLLETVQQHADIREALGELRAHWRREALIHNDLKWDNIIVLHQAGEDSGTFMVIDWELAGIGNPDWDVGSVFAAFLGLWGGSIPVAHGSPPEQLIDLAAHPLGTLQPAAQSFWTAYLESTRRYLPGHQNIEPIMRYCGARLIQAAIERAQLRSTLATDSVLLLQIAQNVLRHPREAAHNLLGLFPLDA